MILMSSTLTAQNAEYSLRALQAGAADYLQKPTTNSELASGQDFPSELLMKLKALGEAGRRKVGFLNKSHRSADKPALGRAAQSIAQSDNWELSSSKQVTLRKHGMLKPKVVAIGSSTGGPEALRDLFSPITRLILMFLSSLHSICLLLLRQFWQIV